MELVAEISWEAAVETFLLRMTKAAGTDTESTRTNVLTVLEVELLWIY
jgi:hypothetical protein